MDQYIAYCHHFGTKPNINKDKAAMCHFGNRSEMSQGTAKIRFPLGALTMTFTAHIILDVTVPVLLFIDEMDHWGLYFNNIINHFIHLDSVQFISITRDGKHTFIQWIPGYTPTTLLLTKTSTQSFWSSSY